MQRLGPDQLRAITQQAVSRGNFANPQVTAEVAFQVCSYILSIPDRWGPPPMAAVAHEDEVLIDVLELVLRDLEQRETRPDDEP
jgi:hypothetical protein